MPEIQPEIPPFLAPVVTKLVTAALYGGLGLIAGSLLGLVIRRLIYAWDAEDRHSAGPLAVVAAAVLLAILAGGVLIAVSDARGYAIIYGLAALVGAASFARPWWSMRR